LTAQDLSDYKVIVQKALHGTYRGQKVYTTNVPASGPVLLYMLNILEHYDLPKEGLTPLNFHRMVESLKCKGTFFINLRSLELLTCLFLRICDVIHSRLRSKDTY
jgi:hypothetical protein